ncbi:preprotein translocase subunit SecA [Mycolicibacterium chlorophenolicum]|uniref:Protein translocase subunit SecA n=1 Tax=Mycolicibacterium chlorophenolicum TaxID=37916 RepID=A0A0J6VLY3_9MYCO|nr:preprotein translocase subunit SecA [Mycolicibacterium chlorophenolicum]KMO72015.1 Protein translocase subunit SecA [Mycolicibacterium chlorophenolicum]
MFTDVLRLGEGRIVRQLSSIADYVDALSADVQKLTDAEMRSKTEEFRLRIADGTNLESVLAEGFAVAREAAWRVLGLRPYRVQVMGGVALHFGNIAEMMTGEGKTLASVMPAYLNAVSGEGVHIVTVNDYLAKRDAEQMGRVHRFLGLKVGVILAEMKPEARRAAYAADITYGTNNELGFDYLRDNMAHHRDQRVQRGHHYAIVDEVDSILIDEARTPLIISGPADDASQWYAEFARLATLMTEDTHYEVDVRKRTVGVRERGVALVEDQLGIGNMYDVANAYLVGHLNNALRAKELFHCDRDYIVTDEGEVLIVDEFTGRVLVGRRYNEGLHQAIEAKEGVEIKPENQTLATITLQNYFRIYRKLAGMTGTAQTEASEFREIYRLGVITIPPNAPMVRRDRADVVYKSELAKFDAVVEDIAERHTAGQPVLIGTTGVDKSEYLSHRLDEQRIPHTVLNAKHLEKEAEIVAEGGRRGAVTVATDMAGRGTDIVLGGSVDFLTDKRLRARGLDPVQTPEEYEAAWRDERLQIKADSVAEADEVRKFGGLYVLGTERHESRRIDNQLRGRAGRQGDPGETRFYLSLGDELMRRFSTVNLEKLMTRLKMPDDEPIKANVVTRAIMSAQTQVEQQNFETRKNVVKYDEVMDQQRKIVYAARSRILDGEDLQRQVRDMLLEVVTAYVMEATAGWRTAGWDLDGLWTALRSLYPITLDRDSLPAGSRSNRKKLLEAVIRDAERALDRREAEIEERVGVGSMRRLERDILLDTIDGKWREHLYEMDYLKEGIGLRAMAQRDPVVEYHSEGYDMFVRMLEAVKEQCVRSLFHATIATAKAAE